MLSGLQISALRVSAAKKTTLTIGMVEPIDSLNPFIGLNDNAYIFYGLVYDYLIAVDGDMKPKPNLATSWNVVSDQLPAGSVWQYNLTRNATWHDGEPFTADDVVFTFDYQIGTNMPSMWAYQPYTKLITNVEEVDNYTVRIHFMDFAYNPAPCSFGDAIMVPIIPKHIWQDIPTTEAGFSYKNYYPIGTGPFMCSKDTESQFIAGERLMLDRNPDYHGYKDYGQQIRFDRVILEWYLEPAAMIADMQRGAIDLAKFDAPNYKNLMDWLDQNPTAAIGHYAGLQCTGFSTELGISMMTNAGGKVNALKLDPAVRRAMALATDKQFIIDHVYKGYADSGVGLLTPMYKDWYWKPSSQKMTSLDQWGPSQGLEIPYSLDMANQSLEDAGYHWNAAHTIRNASHNNSYNPDAQLKFDIIVEAELFEDREVATFLQEEYRKIGIELNLVIMNSAQWNTVVYSGGYDLTITYWSGDPDPNYLLYVQSSNALDGWSDNFYSSAEYDRNYTDSVSAVNFEVRQGLVHNCTKHTYYDVPYIVYADAYGCYAWREDHFSDWGDWGAHPGRSFSNFYTANDLWFDLTPIGGGGSASNLMTYVGIGIAVVLVAAVASTILLRKRRGGLQTKDEDVRLP